NLTPVPSITHVSSHWFLCAVFFDPLDPCGFAIANRPEVLKRSFIALLTRELLVQYLDRNAQYVDPLAIFGVQNLVNLSVNSCRQSYFHNYSFLLDTQGCPEIRSELILRKYRHKA